MLNEYSKCKNCNHINPVYTHICENCRSYLRERVVNIDLWKTIQFIIEDPIKAFTQIIFSEHKNFIFFITFFIAIKNLIFARFLSVPELGLNGVTSSFFVSLILSILISIIVFSINSLLLKSIYKKKNFRLRFKDIYALSTYTFIPFLFSLFFIFPVELIVLGGDIFSNNPYSFLIKPTISYILIAIEFIMILWSFILTYKSIMILGTKQSNSIFLTIILFIIWISSLYISSKIIFTI
jgi:hypothetical protein